MPKSQPPPSHPLSCILLVLFAVNPATGQCIEWQPGSPVAGASGPVYAQLVRVENGNAALYCGGDFTMVANAIARNVVRWDGATWTSLGAGTDGPVRAICTYGTDLFVGGEFSTAGGIAAPGIARWDGVQWSAVGSGDYRTTRALHVFRGELFAGGTFRTTGGAASSYIAKWNGTAWTRVPFGAANGPQNTINSFSVYNNELVAAGIFSLSSNTNQIARFDGTTWRALGYFNTFSGEVAAILLFGNQLFAGGTIHPYAMVWDGADWLALGSGVNGHVTALGSTEDRVIVAGTFTTAGGSPARGIAAWDGAAWQPLASGVSGRADSITSWGNELFVGGRDVSPMDTVGRNLVRWDGTAWNAISGGTDLAPFGAVSFQNSHYVFGTFRTLGNQSTQAMARWDGTEWEGTGLDANSVNCATVVGSNLYAGCRDYQPPDPAFRRIQQWDGNVWSNIASDLDGEVYALGSFNGELVAGGPFTQIDAVPFSGIARFDGINWQSLGLGISSGSSWNAFVEDFAVFQGKLYAGGGFQSAGGIPAGQIACWDGSIWTPLGTGLNNSAWELEVFQDYLYVGGAFNSAGGLTARGMARWDGANWSTLSTTANFFNVSGLEVYNGKLHIGGTFGLVAPSTIPGYVIWDGQALLQPDIPLNGRMSGISQTGDSVMFTGGFTTIGGEMSAFVARGLFRQLMGDINADDFVDVQDLALLLAEFASPAPATGDVDHDSDVDLQDLAVLLSEFGNSCN